MTRFPEGRSFTQAAVDAVVRAGMTPVDMQYFAARDHSPADYCQARVRDSEVYVAVVGFRYGSMAPGETVSYTELEFQAAGAAGLPRLVFLLDEAVKPPGTADADPGLVRQFRQRLRNAGLIVRAFASSDSLELEIFHALSELLGTAPGTKSRPGGRMKTGVPVTSTLPADTSAFSGRGKQLADISAAAAAAAEAGRVVAIHAIDGMPGVGKTSLAVHVAHLVASQFPDRQLFIDLHAHTPGQQPLAPVDALATLLAADGVDPRYLPGSLDDRAAMWRSRLAGKRVLLVLDNAASSDQVAPLLPGAAGCLVLVTSRRYLGDLPSALAPVPLDVLPSGDAQDMFVNLAPRAVSTPEKVTEMVTLCGRLPLAISLLASMFTRHRSWTMDDLISETKAKLLTVKAENRTVAAAFELSYQYLPASYQRFFTYLGLHPGPDIDPYAAAALTGLSYDDTIEALDALHSDRLIAEPAPRRYRMHNLIHEYARSLAASANSIDEA